MTCRLLVTIGIIAGSSLAAGAVGAREWPTDGIPDDATSITIDLHAPPDVRAAADAQLFLEGVDVTEASCAENPQPDRALRQIVCFDLDEGIYDVVVTPGDAGDLVQTGCTDITAARTDASAVQIGAGFTNWSCSAWVGAPTIQLSAPTSDPFDPVLLDPDGSPVTCVTETFSAPTPESADETVRWCTVADGAYTIDESSIAEPYRTGIYCEAAAGSPTDVFIEPFTAIPISDEQPFVSCHQQSQGSALFDIIIEFAPGTDPAVVDGIGFTASDADGNPLTDCEANGPFDVDLTRAAQYFCDAPVGIVDFDLVGVPDDAIVEGQGVADRDCEPLEHTVAVQAICIVRITLPTPAATEPPPTDALPETGTPSATVALLATLLVLAGAAMTLIARSRRPATR